MLPTLPAAGGNLTDPTFGTKIIRITDASDGQYCYHAYSYWPVFNADTTRILYRCGSSGARVAVWNPVTHVIAKRDARLGAGSWQDAIWSNTDPVALYNDKYNLLQRVNEDTGVATTLLDLAAEHSGRWIWQLHMSEDENRFSWTLKDSSTYALLGYAVWQRSPAQYLVYQEGVSDLDEVQISKDGQYLLVKSGVNPRNVIIKLSDLSQVALNDAAPDYATGHSDTGTGFYVGWDYTGPVRIVSRSYTTPHSLVPLLTSASSGHLSLLSTDEAWVTASIGVYGTVDTPYENEILKVATNGSGSVSRWAHHRSVPASAGSYSYWANPFASVSRDGKFIAFNSTWGSNDKIDLFIATIPVATPSTLIGSFSGTWLQVP